MRKGTGAATKEIHKHVSDGLLPDAESGQGSKGGENG